MRRLAALLTLLAGLVFCYAVLKLPEALRLARNPEAMAQEIFPQAGPPTAADRLLQELTATLEGLPPQERIPLWQLDAEGASNPPPLDQVKASLASRSALRSQVLALPQDLEGEGQGPLLQDEHNFRLHRELQQLLADDCLELLQVKRGDEALEVLEVKERLARVVSRGTQNNPSLICRMLGVAFLNYGTRVGVAAREHRLLDDQRRHRMAAILEQALDREPPLELAVNAEFDLAERAVGLVDDRLGLLKYPLRLYWGSGPEQVQSLRKRWQTGWTNLGQEEISRLHIMIQIALPNLEKAQEKVQEAHQARKLAVSQLRVE